MDFIVNIKPDIDLQPLTCLLIDLLCVPGASENDLFGAAIFTSRRFQLKLTFDHFYVLDELWCSLPNLRSDKRRKHFPVTSIVITAHFQQRHVSILNVKGWRIFTMGVYG